MDGAYIPDSSVIKTPGEDKPRYTLTEIQTSNPERLRERNKHKQSKLDKMSVMKKVWASIPYRVYYMSCNLDHVLHNKMNSTDEEKEKNAYDFAKKYKDNIEGFLMRLTIYL